MKKELIKKWCDMTLEEKRASLPKKLNKYGEWLLSEEGREGLIVVKDMRAVLK